MNWFTGTNVLAPLDYGFIAQNDSAMKEWWDKVFKA